MKDYKLSEIQKICQEDTSVYCEGCEFNLPSYGCIWFEVLD